jgi:hypothetical protein
MPGTKEGLILSIWYIRNAFKRSKYCYCGLRNLYFTGISEKVQMVSQEHVICDVSKYGYDEHIVSVI